MLRWNPHFHAILLEGGFDEDGTFVYLPFSGLEKMSEYFRRTVLRFFTDKKLLTEQFVRNMLSWKHSGFSIDNSVRILAERSRNSLAQYIARLPVSLKKIHYEGFKPSDSPQAISPAQGFVRSTKRRGSGAFPYPLKRVFQRKRAYVQGL